MKRILILLLTSIIILSLIGCGSNIADTVFDNTSAQSETESENSNAADETIVPVSSDENDDLSEKQKNSIALLNYLAMVSQKIETSKNNRIYLEEVYSSLLNNTNPAIDEKTQNHIQTMLNIIKDYRQIELKRDRLKYIYEQEKQIQ